MRWWGWLTWVVAGGSLVATGVMETIVNAFWSAMSTIMTALGGITIPAYFKSVAHVLGALDVILPVPFIVFAIASVITIELLIMVASVILKVIQWTTDLVPTGG